MNLPMLPADKANHALYGALIFATAAAVASRLGAGVWTGPAAEAVVVAAAMLKELCDWVLNRRAVSQGLPPPHGVELNDALATAGGGLLCWAAAAAMGG